MFKNIFVYIFILIFTVCPLFSWQGGSGTEADPYQIWTKADMDALADSVNAFQTRGDWSKDKHFKLMADITEPVTQTIGIGANKFQGHFDGNQKTITLAMYRELGLFGGIILEAIVENLNVAGEIIYDNYYTNGIGGIVHLNQGTVQNCNNYASIKALDHNLVGGIVYNNIANNKFTRGRVINCVNYGDIESARMAAGIVCDNTDYVSNCVNVGNIKCRGTEDISAGGIVGFGMNGSSAGFEDDTSMIVVEYCTNIGNVEGSNAAVGGIYGSMSYGVQVHKLVPYLFKNINYGFVHSDNIAGGIAGESRLSNGYNAIISNCLNTGVVSGNNTVGCIIGSANDKITIIDCYFDKQMCPYGGIGGK